MGALGLGCCRVQAPQASRRMEQGSGRAEHCGDAALITSLGGLAATASLQKVLSKPPHGFAKPNADSAHGGAVQGAQLYPER